MGLQGDGFYFCLDDHDVFFWHVVMETLFAGFDGFDFVHNVRSSNNFAKHGVTPARS